MSLRRNKKTRGNYTPEEEAVIRRHISSYPHNLALAFNQASLELGNRTAGAISGHYYGKLKHDTSKPMLAMATSQGVSINTKQTRRPQEVMTKRGLSAFDIAMVAVGELNQDELKALLRHMMSQK
jgi:hypothetical protein